MSGAARILSPVDATTQCDRAEGRIHTMNHQERWGAKA